MVTLIIPAARDGPSFLGGRPVWLAQLPQGQLALQQLLDELDCANVTRVVFVTLRSHVDRYCGGSAAVIEALISETLAAKVSRTDILIAKYTRGCGVGGAGSSAGQHSSLSPARICGGSVTSSPTSAPAPGPAATATVTFSSPSSSGCSLPSVVVVALDSSPQSAPETVAIAIERAGVTGPIFVKDSDGSFVHKIEEGDYVCGLCISDALATAAASAAASNGSGMMGDSCGGPLLGNRMAGSTSSVGGLFAAPATSSSAALLPPLPESTDGAISMACLLSKSFIERTGVLLTNLVEKKLVSDTIAVGGYGFRSAADFVTAAAKAEAIKKKITHALTAEASSGTRVFVSNVVQQMLFDNVAFSVSLTRSSLSDWKTERGWRAYVGSFRNIVASLEGDLFSPPPPTPAVVSGGFGGGSSVVASLLDVSCYVPNEARIDRLVDLKAAFGSRLTIVITSRALPSPASASSARGGGGGISSEAKVRRLLEEHGVPFDSLVLGVPTAQTDLLLAGGRW